MATAELYHIGSAHLFFPVEGKMFRGGLKARLSFANHLFLNSYVLQYGPSFLYVMFLDHMSSSVLPINSKDLKVIYESSSYQIIGFGRLELAVP